jgi:phosphoglycolate phosphatase-like HAD superfamily hydrolase
MPTKLSRAVLLIGFPLLRFAHGFTMVGLQKNPSDSAQLRMSDKNEADPTQFENLKGIIFDIDGTLADSWKLGFDATLVVLEQNQIPPITQETYHECTRYATPDRLARHAGLEPSDPDYDSVGEKLGAEFDNLYVGLVSLETAGYFKGIDQFLQDIPKSIVLGALTNACVDYAYAVLKSNNNLEKQANGVNMYDRFQSIRGADNVPAPKPAPDGLFQVCKDLSLKPEDCVYIGDSPSDAMAAYNAGMPAIGVLWGSHSEENVRKAPFDHVCRTVDELRFILNVEVCV